MARKLVKMYHPEHGTTQIIESAFGPWEKKGWSLTPPGDAPTVVEFEEESTAIEEPVVVSFEEEVDQWDA